MVIIYTPSKEQCYSTFAMTASILCGCPRAWLSSARFFWRFLSFFAAGMWHRVRWRQFFTCFTMTSLFTAPSTPTSLVPTPIVCSIPNLSIPSKLPTCKEEWERLAASNTDTIVYSLVWHGAHLVAVTSSGHVCIWKVPIEQDESMEEMDQEERCEIFEKLRRPLVK